MPLPDLDGKTIWIGISTAYGEQFIMELYPSKEYLGYYHIAMACLADTFACYHDEAGVLLGLIDQTRRPVRADGVEERARYLLNQHGLVVADMHWSKSEKRLIMDDKRS